MKVSLREILLIVLAAFCLVGLMFERNKRVKNTRELTSSLDREWNVSRICAKQSLIDCFYTRPRPEFELYMRNEAIRTLIDLWQHERDYNSATGQMEGEFAADRAQEMLFCLGCTDFDSLASTIKNSPYGSEPFDVTRPTIHDPESFDYIDFKNWVIDVLRQDAEKGQEPNTDLTR